MNGALVAAWLGTALASGFVLAMVGLALVDNARITMQQGIIEALGDELAEKERSWRGLLAELAEQDDDLEAARQEATRWEKIANDLETLVFGDEVQS